MNIEPVVIVKNSIITLILGFSLICVFDILSMLIENLEIKNKKILFEFKDFVSSITFCLLSILIIFYFNQGVIRAVYILSIIFGIVVYYIIFRKIIRNIARIILTPFNYILKITTKLINFLFNSIEKKVLKLYNK